MNPKISSMVGVGGEKVALTGVNIRAQLQDLLAQVEMEQSYRNDETSNIEAVYTFSLPLDAVLLELEVQLGDRLLTGEVIAKSEAEERYESAIEEGDSAVMLEQIEPGLYTMNVGNLAAGESALVRFTYSVLHRWSGSQFRFSIPTTIAPRYGDSPHQPHQAPQHSLSVENNFSLYIEVFGALRDAQFLDPSFACAFSREADRALLKLNAEQAVMDRDFVVTVESKNTERSFALCDQDLEGVAALASFQPFFPGLCASKPLSLIVIVDCSGSMSGDSIAQAKKALAELLNQVGPQDQMTIIAFGSTQNALAKKLLACTPSNVKKLKTFCEQLEADLGGTEIEAALELGYQIAAKTPACDLFLITDGEVSRWEPVVKKARTCGHRIFTVGVGHSVAEAFARGLASATAGACELVMPTEAMAARIVRHFERLRAPKAKSVRILWPEGARECSPAELGAVFDGDSLTVSAQLPALDESAKVVLELETESGAKSRQELALTPSSLVGSAAGPSTIARLAAAIRMQAATDDAARTIALEYRLVSRYTNWIVVAERGVEDRLDEAPALRVVPQTLAAGWGGTGSTPQRIGTISSSLIRPMFDAGGEAVLGSKISVSVNARASQHIRASIDSPALWRDPRPAHASRVTAGKAQQNDLFDIPAFLSGDADGSSRPQTLGKGSSSAHGTRSTQFDPGSRIAALIRLIEEDPSWLSEGRGVELLHTAGFDEVIDEIFDLIGSAPIDPQRAIEVVLGLMLSDQVISALPAKLQSRARSLHHRALQIMQESRLTSDRAAKALEFLVRSDPHDFFAPQIIDQARVALTPLADLRRLVEKIEVHARFTAQDAVRERAANSPA